jgi:hypothetical protein
MDIPTDSEVKKGYIGKFYTDVDYTTFDVTVDDIASHVYYTFVTSQEYFDKFTYAPIGSYVFVKCVRLEDVTLPDPVPMDEVYDLKKKLEQAALITSNGILLIFVAKVKEMDGKHKPESYFQFSPIRVYELKNKINAYNRSTGTLAFRNFESFLKNYPVEQLFTETSAKISELMPLAGLDQTVKTYNDGSQKLTKRIVRDSPRDPNNVKEAREVLGTTETDKWKIFKQYANLINSTYSQSRKNVYTRAYKILTAVPPKL